MTITIVENPCPKLINQKDVVLIASCQVYPFVPYARTDRMGFGRELCRRNRRLAVRQ